MKFMVLCRLISGFGALPCGLSNCLFKWNRTLKSWTGGQATEGFGIRSVGLCMVWICHVCTCLQLLEIVLCFRGGSLSARCACDEFASLGFFLCIALMNWPSPIGS